MLSTAKRTGQETLFTAAKIRRDEVFDRLKTEIGNSDLTLDAPSLLYHRSCYKTYTSKHNLLSVHQSISKEESELTAT